MKFLSCSGLVAAALIVLSSCYKQSNVNNGNSSANAPGGVIPVPQPTFDWTGTAPLSAKGNGIFVHASDVSVISNAGYYYILGTSDDGNIGFGPSVPVNAVEGQIYSMPSPVNLNWQFDPGSGMVVLGAVKGKCKIVTNNATTIEGYFLTDTKDYSGLHDTTVNVTEGYFKVTKP